MLRPSFELARDVNTVAWEPFAHLFKRRVLARRAPVVAQLNTVYNRFSTYSTLILSSQYALPDTCLPG